MGFIGVIAAGVAGFVLGAIYYGVLSKTWMEASGVAVGEDGKPANSSDPLPYIMGLIAMILVAGMMRHTFALSGIETVGKGTLAGLGIGLFMSAPWLMICYGFAGRDKRLILIDGGYATLGCGIIGLVLTLF